MKMIFMQRDFIHSEGTQPWYIEHMLELVTDLHISLLTYNGTSFECEFTWFNSLCGRIQCVAVNFYENQFLCNF